MMQNIDGVSCNIDHLIHRCLTQSHHIHLDDTVLYPFTYSFDL